MAAFTMIASHALLDRLEADAVLHGEPIAEAVRHHLIGALILRIARHPLTAESFVLRGGMLTRHWVMPELQRPTRDLDYVGDFPFDVDDTLARFTAAVRVEGLDDSVDVDPQSVVGSGIWLETAFPGVRIRVRVGLSGAEAQEVSLDIGFRDPLVPPAYWIRIRDTDVRAVRPETQVAWKLHALAEMGSAYRPKDLADLWRITSRVSLDRETLPAAIDAAFVSRGYTLDQARAVLVSDHWSTKTARVRWAPSRTGPGLPPLPRVLDDVRARLAPALAALTESSPLDSSP